MAIVKYTIKMMVVLTLQKSFNNLMIIKTIKT